MEFVKYYPDALRFAKRLTKKDVELAEDIVQDIFLKVIKNGIVIDGEKNYKGYLNTAIRHKYFSECLKKKSGKYKGINVEVHEGWNVPEKIYDMSFSDPLVKALGSTKSGLTLPFILNVVHDYGHEEIAKIMNIPIGTVRSKIHRARKALRQKLAA